MNVSDSFSLKNLDSHQLGACGEYIASLFLIEKGYVIVDRNYRSKGGEIDIICSKNNTIFFVEVRTSRSKFHRAQETLSSLKISRILHTAYQWLAETSPSYSSVQCDLIAIDISSQSITLSHHSCLESWF